MLSILLQAAAPGQGGSMMSSLVMIVLIFVIFYFFMIRPQRKRQKELDNFRASLQVGDQVVTIGGIYGKVAEIGADYIMLEVSNNVKIKFDKNAISNGSIQNNN